MALGKILVADDDRNIADCSGSIWKRKAIPPSWLRTERKPLQIQRGHSGSGAAGHYDAQAGWLAGMPGDPQKVQLPDHYDHRQG